MNIGFLASHNGSNMQAIVDACKSGKLTAVPSVVISNNGSSGALRRAAQEQIPGYHLSSKTHPDPSALDQAIVDVLHEHDVDVVVLAGYMKRLGQHTLRAFSGRILNIHPSLLPKFGGQGMYGIRVHEAVIAAGETQTGVTIHVVEGDYDTGPIVAQRTVPVVNGDTPQTVAERVLRTEHQFFSEVLQKIVVGEITLAP